MSQQPPPFPQQDNTGAAAYQPQGFVCPKCRGTMRTYDRNGVHLEQCDQCRASSSTSVSSSTCPSSRPASRRSRHRSSTASPAWGNRGGQHYRKKGMSGLFFSS